METRIACGEEDATRWGFAQLLERSQVDVIQPDVTRAGGISECLRIAQLAELHGVTMVPHAWSTGIIKAASLHLLGAMPQATFLEYCVQETALNQLLTVERFPVVDGMVALPTGRDSASRSTRTWCVATRCRAKRHRRPDGQTSFVRR